MGFLLVRERDDGETVRVIPEEEYAAESVEEDLHRFVEAHPELISADGNPLLVVMSKQSFSRHGWGELDLVAIARDGGVILVEFKRDSRSANYRDVVAQILEYATYLWTVGYEEFARQAMRYLREQGSKYGRAESLSEAVSIFAADQGEEIDAKDIEDNVKSALGDKKQLQMLIVASSITRTIREVTAFLRKVYGMKIFCLEFDYYRDKTSEFFIPKLIGDEKVRADITSPERMTRDRLLDEIEDPRTKDCMSELLGLAEDLGLKEARREQTVSFQHPSDGILFRVASRYAGRLMPNVAIPFKGLLEVHLIHQSQQALMSHNDYIGGGEQLCIAVTPDSMKEITKAIRLIFDYRSKAEKST